MARRRHIVVRQQSSGCLLTLMKLWFIWTVGIPVAGVALILLLAWLRT